MLDGRTRRPRVPARRVQGAADAVHEPPHLGNGRVVACGRLWPVTIDRHLFQKIIFVIR